MEYKQIKYFFILVVLMSSIVGGWWCSAENFFAPQPSLSRKQSASHLKQDIAEFLAELLNKSISMIRLKAGVQQELYNRIRELADNNKQAHLVKTSSKQDLVQCLEYLQKCDKQWTQQIQELTSLLHFLHDGCKLQSESLPKNTQKST